MSTDEFLKQYQAALKDLANAKVSVRVLEMQAKILAETKLNYGSKPAEPEQKSKLQRFVEANRDLLEPDCIDFLAKPERTSSEVADFLALSTNWVTKRLRSGIYRPGKSDSPGKRMIDTISVVEHLIHHVETPS